MGELVVVGRVVKPHGLRGEVAIDLLTDVSDRFRRGAAYEVGGSQLTLASARGHQGRLLVRFEGVDDRVAAERLRGLDVRADVLSGADSDTYFAHELVGLAVEDADGHPLGTVAALIELPSSAAYDLLEVTRADGTTWLLPAVEAYVEVVGPDGAETLRVVDPPEGLVPEDGPAP